MFAGLKTRSYQQIISMTYYESRLLVEANPNRIGLFIYPTRIRRFTISLEDTALLDQGITLYPGNKPLLLTREKHGELVSRAWTAKTELNTLPVYVVETFPQ